MKNIQPGQEKQYSYVESGYYVLYRLSLHGDYLGNARKSCHFRLSGPWRIAVNDHEVERER